LFTHVVKFNYRIYK